MIVRVPGKWKFSDDREDIFFTVFPYMKCCRSLYNATIALKYPEEKWNNTVENEIKNKVMP
jgi:hypothetical protein